MEKLVILDYSTGEVDVYDIDSDVEVNEYLIESLGHNSNDCYWMVGENIKITFNSEIVRNGNKDN